MSNFKADILKATEGEIIECVVIIQLVNQWHYGGADPRDTRFVKENLNEPIPWDIAQHCFDYEYDDGFGSMDCHDIVIYTDKKIHYIHEYDGSTSIWNVCKNPEDYRKE